jgi:hypothetical protein
MKKIVFIILVIYSASQATLSGQTKDLKKVKPDTTSVDSLEHRLIILDPGFDAWLASKPPKEYYSKEYYALKNRLYVTEWNSRYMTSRNHDLYQTYIDYDYNTDYGLDINYRLYYYFRYFEEVNRVRLLP